MQKHWHSRQELAILKFLAKQQSCICSDIVDERPLSQSTVSQHLKELKKAGLIKGETDGAKCAIALTKRMEGGSTVDQSFI